MKTIKILITDDSIENLNAAKQAVTQFPNYEFVFTSSAEEALALLPSVDAVVTDLFFEEEISSDGELTTLYDLFKSKVAQTKTFSQVVEEYYNGELHKGWASLLSGKDVLESGMISSIISKGGFGDMKEHLLESASKLKPQFPFGGAIMLRAKEIGKKHCLVSDIHRHASVYKDATSSVDGMILLLPLIEAEIVSIKQATFDGDDSLTYFGSDQINRLRGRDDDWEKSGKTKPDVWVEAIKRVIAQ